MSTSNKKPIFRTAFREWLESRGHDLARLQDRQISRLMTEFYINEIIRRTRPGLLPDDPEDLESCYVDASADRGIDFVFRSDDGFVLVLQCKYRSSERPEKLDEVEAFCRVLRRHHPQLGATLTKNQRVLEAFSDVDWEHDTFELQYITLGKVSDEVRKWSEDLPDCFPDVHGIADRVDVSVLTETELNQQLREAISTTQAIGEPVIIRFTPSADGVPWFVYENSNGATSYIGLVNAAQFHELYKRYKTTLFSLNIRNYIGDTSTNKGIIETAVKEPEDFFFYNNGISAVASQIDADFEQGVLRCSRFSIINGAQTVRSLAKAHTKHRESVRSVYVMFRASAISLSDDNLIANVTRYNNTQNSIKISDFRSNDPVQRVLAKRFSDLPARAGKAFTYKNKRSEREANKIPIGMEEFTKTVFAFLVGPPDAYGGTNHLFDTGKDGGYSKVFGDGSEVWTTVNKDEFERLAGVWFVCEQARAYYKIEKAALEQREEERKDVTPVVKDALERRWMVFYALGCLLRAKYRTSDELDRDLRRFARRAMLSVTRPRTLFGAIQKGLAKCSFGSTAPQVRTRRLSTATGLGIKSLSSRWKVRSRTPTACWRHFRSCISDGVCLHCRLAHVIASATKTDDSAA
jgi:hypothetical protein